jgi:hypothetical protein
MIVTKFITSMVVKGISWEYYSRGKAIWGGIIIPPIFAL